MRIRGHWWGTRKAHTCCTARNRTQSSRARTLARCLTSCNSSSVPHTRCRTHSCLFWRSSIVRLDQGLWCNDRHWLELTRTWICACELFLYLASYVRAIPDPRGSHHPSCLPSWARRNEGGQRIGGSWLCGTQVHAPIYKRRASWLGSHLSRRILCVGSSAWTEESCTACFPSPQEEHSCPVTWHPWLPLR